MELMTHLSSFSKRRRREGWKEKKRCSEDEGGPTYSVGQMGLEQQAPKHTESIMRSKTKMVMMRKATTTQCLHVSDKYNKIPRPTKHKLQIQ